ncbi:MAG: hydroxyacid dehydrogenase [Clostridia bacterium]|nr:hydroxyacid dehydrogenase [Clostridia bacterium]
MNLLITGAWTQARKFIPQIKELRHEVIFMQQEKDPLPCTPEWPEGIICNSLFLTYSIETFKNLKYIQLTSAGYDRVPIDYIQLHNIEIHNARGVYSIPMAEFVIAEVLSIYKHLNEFRIQQEQHEWHKHRDLQELNGKTVVILGCGSVGTECAKRFKMFGCTVIGMDIIKKGNVNYNCIKPITELDSIISIADILLITLPLTKETKGLINEERLQKIRKNAILVNISRGAIIDVKALEAWNGQAILDVFDEEPLDKGSILWKKEGFILTPHNCFESINNQERLRETLNNTSDFRTPVI